MGKYYGKENLTHVFTENITQTQAIITGADVNHLKNVLRMKIGDELYVSDGNGRDVLCSIVQISDDKIVADILQENARASELPVKIVLYQALPKSDKMEMIIQKCVELGASRIVPVESSRCIVKLDSKSRVKKVERWRKIAESAAKQSQRGIIPEISEVMSFKEAVSDAQSLSKSIFTYEESTTPDGLKTLLEGAESLTYDSIGIFVGPEGGWEASEAETASQSGIESITLGHRILRTETAGMALISALMLNIESGIKDAVKPALKIVAGALLIGTMIVTGNGKAYATMNLETGASIGGISVALNNLYARSLKPEKALNESVKMVANGSVVIDEEKPNEATQKLVESTEIKQETIVTEEGTTYGKVHGTQTLRLRDNPNHGAKTLTLLAEGESYVVTDQDGDFLKVKVDEDLEGWVFKDYIQTEVKLDAEITEEEKAAKAAEAARLKAEAEKALKELEELKKAEKEKKSESKAETKTETRQETVEETTKPKETVETKPKETIESKPKETIEAKPKETTKATEETVEAPPEKSGEELIEVEAPTEKDTTKAETKKETKETQKETTKPKETEAETVAQGPGAISVNSATRNAMVAYAKQFLGNPYVYGGTDLYNGIDCSAYVQAIYKNFGYSIGRSSRDQAAQFKTIDSGSAQPGDLFFYDSGGTINHVAMYIGNGQVIHASSSTTGIIISNAYYRTPCKVGKIID